MSNENQEISELDEGTMAQDSLKPGSRPSEDPRSKVEYLSTMIGAMHTMKKDDLVQLYNGMMANFGHYGDAVPTGISSKNQATVRMKSSVKEGVEDMFAGQDLSEEFKEKASTLFEAAVNATINLELARLEEEYETKFEESINEAVEQINEELVNKIDTYLDYVVENWMDQNSVAIESTLRTEIMTDFIGGLKGLFAEHYIEVPEDKVNVIESLAHKVEQLEDQNDSLVTENVNLRHAFVDVERENILESLKSDMALSQQEKFAALAEGIDFDGDLDTYARKLSIIKENYFGVERIATTSTNIEEETFEGEVAQTNAHVDPSINRYAQAISRSIKK